MTPSATSRPTIPRTVLLVLGMIALTIVILIGCVVLYSSYQDGRIISPTRNNQNFAERDEEPATYWMYFVGWLTLLGSLGFAWVTGARSLVKRMRSHLQSDALPDLDVPLDALGSPKSTGQLKHSELTGVLQVDYPRTSLPRTGITVDMDARTIRFENCFYRAKSMSIFRAAPEQTCSFEDMLEVMEVSSKGGSCLWIVTRVGKAYIPTTVTNYEQFLGLLTELCKATPPAAPSQNPMALHASMGVAMLGMGTGILLTPERAGTSILLLFAVVGATLAAGCFFFILSKIGTLAHGVSSTTGLLMFGGAAGAIGVRLMMGMVSPPTILSLLVFTGIGLAIGYGYAILIRPEAS